MAYLFAKIFFVAFFINLLYELLHSVLYITCLKAPLKKYQYLILKGAVFDGIIIVVIYYATVLVFKNYAIFQNVWQVILFSLINLFFAYGWEIYSLKKKKWGYAKTMPTILGAGVTPTIQLTVTGLLSLYMVFNFFI